MPLIDEPEKTPSPRKSWLESILPYTTVAVIIAALYAAWVFYSRHERALRAQAEVEAARNEARKRVVEDVFGSGEIKFTAFAVDRALLRRGETASLCYGVVNASSVKIEPSVGDVKVSYHTCLEIAPKVTTTYTMTARNQKGDTKTASLTLQVK